jgi:hypothetical protein
LTKKQPQARIVQQKIKSPTIKVGSGYPWTGRGKEPQWKNQKSTKAYDHIASTHGPKRKVRKFQGRMARTGTPQGQWYNSDDWVLAEQLIPKHLGRYIIDFERPIGRVYHPDGSITEGVTRAFIQRNIDGTLNCGYPVTDDFVIK